MHKQPVNQPRAKQKAAASSMRLALENRLLFDGAVVATAAEVMDDKAGQDQQANESAGVSPDPAIDSAQGAGDIAPDLQNFVENVNTVAQPMAITSTVSAENANAPNLLIIDSRVQGIDQLVQNAPKDTDVRVLDSNSDGYQQIDAILNGRSATTKLEIVAADLDGKQWLGTSQLNSTLTAANSEAIADWSDRLDDTAKIVFHSDQSFNNVWLYQVNALTGNPTSWTQAQDTLVDTKSITNQDPQTATKDDVSAIPATVDALPEKTLVFVDTAVKDYQTLLTGIDPNATVILLDPNKDGVEQIYNTVLNYNNIASIHIVSHGNAGQLHLGSAVLNQDNMQGLYAEELAVIGGHLTLNADILLYGCDIGSGETGQKFVSTLSYITGSDVAVSTNTTGAASFGGDWVLEKSTGIIEAGSIVSAQAQAQYTDVLRSPNTPIAGLANTPTSNFTATLADTFQINADASITSDVIGGKQEIQLTPELNNQKGSAWSKYQIDLSQNFTIDFDVYLGTIDALGADGIAFTLQNNGPDITGDFGGGLGVQNIPKAVAIEFDTWDNGINADRMPVSDIANDHISMYQPKTPTFAGQALGSSAPKDLGNIEDGRWYNAVVTWNAATKTLSYVFGGPSGNVSDSTVINDPRAVFGDNNVYFGWTSSTGAALNDQRVAINSLTNLTPNAVPDSKTVPEDTPAPVKLGGTDVDGTITAVTVATLPLASQGILTKADGSPVVAGVPLTPAEAASLVFKPAPNFNGVVDIPFTVTDNSGTVSDPVDATVTVTPVNDPPVAVPDSKTVPEDTPAPVKLTGTDVDGTVTAVTVIALPPASQGILTKADGSPVVAGVPLTPAEAASLVFKPAPNFNGVVDIPFAVTDNNGAISAPINATVTVTPVNDPPVAIPDNKTVPEDTPAPVKLTGTDVDGTVSAVTVTALPPASQGILAKADGSPVVAGVPLTPAEAAALIFKPAPNFNGVVNIPFTVTDNNGAISLPVNATVTVTPVNDPPVPISGSTNTPADTNAPVKLTGTDVDGTVTGVTVTALPPASQGVLYLADGVTPVVAGAVLTPAQAAGLIFDPTPAFSGIANIPFTVTDNNGATSVPGSFVVDVRAVDADPVATPATVSGPEDTPVPVNLTGTDAEGPITAVTVTSLPPATQGILTKADGSPVVAGVPLTPAEAAGLKFVPAPNFNGSLTIPFTVTDSVGQVSSPPANLTINITPVNDPPVATSVSYSGSEDTPVPVSLTGTDVDGTVTAVTVTALPPVTQGILYLPDGTTPVKAGAVLTPAQAASLVFKPAPDFNGVVNVPFTVTDNNGAVSAPANANITIAPVNDPPVAISGSVNTPADTNAPVNLKGTDVDGTVASVTVTALPPASQGVLYLADGVTPVVAGTTLTPEQAAGLIFDPAPTFSGIASIPFTVTDNSGATSAPGKFVVDVNSVDKDPIATPTTVKGNQDTPVPVSLTGTDAEGPITAVTVTSLPPVTQGILTKADGSPVVAGVPLTPAEAAGLKFVPAPGFAGSLTIPFTVTDSVGQISSPPANLSITIGHPPVANDDGPVPTKSNALTKGNVLDNDTDADGDPLTVTQFTIPGVGTFNAGSLATIPGVGTLVIRPNGSFVFTPDAGYSGPVPKVAYTITDGISTSTANLTLADVPRSEGVNIGSIIMLANPTPPLFPPAAEGGFTLLPLEEFISRSDGTFNPSHLSLYVNPRDCDIYLTSSFLPNQVLSELQRFTFSVSPNIFSHCNPNEELIYQATQLNGAPLSRWIHFDPKQLRFSGVPPKGAKDTEIMIKASDSYGNVAHAAFKVTVNENRGLSQKDKIKLKTSHLPHQHGQHKHHDSVKQQAMATGKLGFNDQLSNSGKLSRMMESRALLSNLDQI